MILRTIAAAALLVQASAAVAQSVPVPAGNPPNTPPGPAMEGNANALLSQADRAFLVKDAQGAAFERELATLASTAASRPEVKRYAQEVARDHTEYNAALQTLGEDNGMTLPDAPDADQVKRLEQFRAMQGSQFDAEFVKEMEAVNQDDAADAKAELDGTMNAGIHNFILRFKPVDDRHMEEARRLAGPGGAS